MPKPLQIGAFFTLAALIVDVIAWAMGQTLLHPIAVLAAIAWIVGTLLASPNSRDAQQQPGTPGEENESEDSPSSRELVETSGSEQVSTKIAEALTLWNEAAALADVDGTILWANPACARRHGLDDPVGKRWSDFYSPDAHHRWQPLLDDVARRGAASGLLDHKGPEAWTSHASFIAVGEGEKKNIFMAAIRLSADEASLRNQTREIGHSLNNVLSAVVGNVGLAIETPGIDKDLQNDLREAESGALRAAELIHGLQALARGEA